MYSSVKIRFPSDGKKTLTLHLFQGIFFDFFYKSLYILEMRDPTYSLHCTIHFF